VIIVRDIFQLQFGKAREAIALIKEGRTLFQASGYPVERILTDVTGEYYTLIMESRLDSLSDLEAILGNPPAGWSEIYAKFIPLVKSGRREVLREVG
jgi:hypothetical protein